MKVLKLFVSLCLVLSFNSFAQENQTKAQKSDMTQRQSMARMHEQMAECLRGGKDVSECRQTVWRDMEHMRSMGICPMTGEEMDRMMGGKGMRGGRGHMGAGRGSGMGRGGQMGAGQTQQPEQPAE